MFKHIDSACTAVSLSEFEHLASRTPGSFSDLPTVLRLRVDECSLSGDSELDNNLKYTVFITDKELVVFSQSVSTGISLDYPSIMLHAVSASTNSIFLQIDERTENIDDFESKDIHIHPQNPSILHEIYEKLSFCASLHQNKFPSEEDDDGDAMIDDGVGLSDQGAANLARFDDMLDNQDKHTDKKQKQ
ncbi:hypothetical protein E3P92_01054 [Wallemia ichthyophaga]|uniref:Regulator of volume decrease after cellular swelling-domain-containing protein n=2 Tax=Wallemia ichthyophaga TaxID=245174 RepID=A0A4T0HMN2_WALIC|nr:uncharacterized protein J056_000407 [Wallemia ichthyophaga EXF-994]TIA70106.1 hypothetical protein E3P91_03285 [Wallemia ichthyophaga]EOR04653.1 hypothetical protein J056_000407 [Wallemia ichthyophaga EXF-994]TIA79533.1 hypothetical protein E3P98_03231 [Wallemia ichthyophaga]TIB02385.1 hypothetical protein E3P95_01005 [Wallemia ichthyophaga]TIB03212.1 hypothetical protein E3P94_01137 [Wallemia ichthyophaga]